MPISINTRPYAYAFSGNPVYYELYSAAAAGNPAIYFELRLNFYNGQAFTTVGPFPFVPVAGKAQVNVADLLEALTVYDLPTASPGNVIQQAVGQCGQYWIEYREITPGVAPPAWETGEADYIRQIVRGGIDDFAYRGNNYFANWQQPGKRFLTWQPSGRNTGVDEKTWLLFYNNNRPTGFTEIFARLTGTYDSGNPYSVDTAHLYVQDQQLYFIPAGAVANGLIQPGRKLISWTVAVYYYNTANSSEQLGSEVFGYTADHRHSDHGQTIHFRNSLGGLDSVFVRGVVATEVDGDFQLQERVTAPDYFSGKAVQPFREAVNPRMGIVYSGDVGFHNRDQQERLLDMLTGRNGFIIRSNKWLPINILTKNFKLRTTDDQLFSFPIQWQLAQDGGRWFTPSAVDLGDAGFHSNVCSALFNNISATWQQQGDEAIVTVTFDVDDWANTGVTQFWWRVAGLTAGATVNLADLPLVFALGLNGSYNLELRPACSGGNLGNTYVTQINT